MALLVFGSGFLRAPTRIAAFAASLFMLLKCRGGGLRHPAGRIVPMAIGVLLLGLVNPLTPSPVAALAQMMLYLATMGPLIWVAVNPMSTSTFRRVLLVFWTFSILSASTGALQIYFPRFFVGQLSAVVAEKGAAYIGSLTIELADGNRILRPMGLTDSPGGAASAAMYAFLFGGGILLIERNRWLQGLAVAGMFVGLFVMYLTYVRLTFVMALIGITLIGLVLMRRREWRRLAFLTSVCSVVIIFGSMWAFAVGGEKIVQRFMTLVDSDPQGVYVDTRGVFLEDTFTRIISEYPFGAGLGRWGMINYYFGTSASGLWSEIMWTSWIYDGGIVLMVLSCVMMGAILWVSWQIAIVWQVPTPLAVWGGVIFAYNFAALVATFSAPIFATQAGMEVWFLNACLFNVCQTWIRAPTPTVPPHQASLGAELPQA